MCDDIEAGKEGLKRSRIVAGNPTSELIWRHAEMRRQLLLAAEAHGRCAEYANIAMLPVHQASERASGVPIALRSAVCRANCYNVRRSLTTASRNIL